MATFTATLAEEIPEEAYKPNVRPDGPEKSPDHKWRAWRLRHQRPEIRAIMPESFPNINQQLREHELAKIKQFSSRRAPPRAPALFEPRKLEDLKARKPIRLEFRPLTEFFNDIDMERQRLRPRKIFRNEEEDSLPQTWLTEMTQGLFARVWDFCADTFGRECFGGRVDDRDWTDFILRELPADFIKCASSVARGDPARHPKPNDPHSYEHLFLAKNERVFLMVGTISKLLELNVFDSLLFGALEDEAKTLKLQDKTTAHVEDGYQRNLARTNLIRQYLTSGRDLEPQLFWDEVDRVTMGILGLLLPMINFLGVMSPLREWPTLTDVHQNLHNIVAEAAKLTNGLRVCRSVCWINYPLTGDLWESDQEQTTDVVYNESLRRTSELDARAFNEAQQMRDWAIRRADAAETTERSWPGQSEEEWVHRWESRSPKPFDRSRRAAKVQIILWPSFTAHFPVMQNTATGGGINVGEERHRIIKAQVVYYSGRCSDEGDQAEDFTLLQHIEKHGGLADNRKVDRFGHFGHCGPPLFRLLTCFFIALLLLCASSLNPPSQQQFGPQVDVEVIEEHEFAGSPIFTRTRTTANSAETGEPSDTTLSSASTSTAKSAFWLPFSGEKVSSDGMPAASATSTPLSAEMEPEAISMPSGLVPKTVAGRSESASTASSKLVSVSSKSSSLKSTTTTTVTESEWTQTGKDGAKRIMSVSPLGSTGKKAEKLKTKSPKSTTSTKPKPVTEEDGVRRPVSVAKPESIESPASLSSPPSPPEAASPSVGYWNWLNRLYSRRLLNNSAESNEEHLTTSPATQPVLTMVEETKTIIEPDEFSFKSTVPSKADEPKSADEATMAPDSKPLSSRSFPVPEDGTLLADDLNVQATTSDPSTPANNNEDVTKIIDTDQVTTSGLGHPVITDGAVESSSSSRSSPTTDNDVWDIAYASIVTYVSKWTNTRVKAYAAENGQVVTVSEEVPQSKESLKSIAPWHRHLLPM